MDEILMIRGDSSNIYEFSSKQVDVLDDSWSGSWAVSVTLGSSPILHGKLIKNNDILNDDSLINEEIKKAYRIFEPNTGDNVVFGPEMYDENQLTITGTAYDNLKKPLPNKHIYINIKGIFALHSREIRIKTDINGVFTCIFNLNKTIRTPQNSFFIFQILPMDSQKLVEQSYFVSVEVQQKNESGLLIFRKEVLQSKLKIKQQGII